MMNALVLLFASLILAADSVQPAAASPNLLVNSSLELGEGKPSNWKPVGNFEGVEYIWERQIGRTGSSSLGFRKTVNRYMPIAQWTQEFKHGAANQNGLEVSAWVKAAKVTKAVIDVQFENAAGESSHKWAAYIGAEDAGDPPVDHDWKEYRGVVRIPDDATAIRISLQMYGPGTVWFDDIEAKYALPPEEAPEAVEAQGIAPAIRAQDLIADNDINKRYYLIGPKSDQAPANGYKLLLVLPGGDGSAEFHGFVKNIALHAVADEYIVAQLVAPRWTAQQAKELVWPVAKNTVPEARFTTEEFINDVIVAVRERHAIDAKHIYMLSWSSGGPPAYSAILSENSPIVGGLVAMSVFKPEILPPLGNAKGKAFYILHSPQDQIPIQFAEQARDVLATHGAATVLKTYAGGHGWRGDVFGMIRDGVKWLEDQRSQK